MSFFGGCGFLWSQTLHRGVICVFFWRGLLFLVLLLYHTPRLAVLSFSAALRFSDDFDLRFPFGKQHWDSGEFMPRFLFTVGSLFMFGVQFPSVIEAVILWRHRHEPIAHGPRKCASVA